MTDIVYSEHALRHPSKIIRTGLEMGWQARQSAMQRAQRRNRVIQNATQLGERLVQVPRRPEVDHMKIAEFSR